MFAFRARLVRVAQRAFHNIGKVLSYGVSGNVSVLVEDEEKVDHVAS